VDSLRRLRRLSWSNRWLLLGASLGLPLTALALRWLGLLRCGALVHRTAVKATPLSAGEAEAAAKMVGWAARRGPYRAGCLEQSLVLLWFLRRHGFPCELRIGARTDGGRLEAHAWVEVRGSVLDDRNGAHLGFTAFERPILSSDAEARPT
jgi:hypothetical protein